MDSIKVKNIGRTIVYLNQGPIEPGREGLATRAELSTLYQYLEKVPEKKLKEKPDPEPEVLPHPKDL